MTNAAADDDENGANEVDIQIPMQEPLPVAILSIIDHLSRIDKIVFKSQQIDDPELNVAEKKSIALEIFQSNPKTFLMRFGKYLEAKHLDDLKTFCLEGCDYDEEIDSILFELQKNLEKRKCNIKNRRYAAMKELMKEDDYFSEREMMKREPHFYEALVGQYLTNREKDIRDGFDPKNTPFSSILMHNLEKDRIEELRKKQKKEEGPDESSSQLAEISSTKTENDSMVENDEMFPEIPPAFRKHWGSFDDEDDSNPQLDALQLAGPSSFKPKPKEISEQKYITASEREMLRQEFMGIMYTKFIDGDDKDFDYSAIDDNSNLDDLRQINQDLEDEYFRDDDDEDYEIDKQTETFNERMENDHVSCESEDDLDTYMRHLNQHHSIQK